MTYSFKVWKLYFAYLFHILVKLEKGWHGAFFFFFFFAVCHPPVPEEALYFEKLS